MPPQCRLLELGRPLLGQEVEIVERVDQAGTAELAERDLRMEEIARCDRAGEASVCRSLGSHSPKGAGERESSGASVRAPLG